MQHDVGGDFKITLSVFSGQNEDWLIWTARIEAHVGAVVSNSGGFSSTDRTYLDGRCAT